MCRTLLRGTLKRCPAAQKSRETCQPPEKEKVMKRFIIEREIPGASELSEEQLAEIARTSNTAAASLGVPYTWVNSYVAGDKVYCVHEAEDEDTIREHSR